MHYEKNGWSVVYEQAIREDGSLYFPERLSKEFLENARRTMGSYLFANQYLNQIIPEGEQIFKPEWLRYYKSLPVIKNTFGFIDPAISEQENADFTALVIIDVDSDQNWYVRNATRYKINPTQIVELVFKAQTQFQCQAIGIEAVAYQKALLYMLDEEMRRRNVILPVKGIKADNQEAKEVRIRGLVPRFEWARVFLAQGLHDLELELAQFPRGKHDDVLDALAYMERLVFYPSKERGTNEKLHPNDPGYERQFLQQLTKRSQSRDAEL